MKSKLSLLLVFIGVYFNVSAQEFAPYGAEWHYTAIDRFDEIYHQAKSVDSIEIDGKKCRIIEVDHSCYLSGEVIVYSTADGDSVFWYEPNSEVFQLIYAFDAQQGDSWSFAGKDSFDSLSKIDSVVVTVDSTTTIEINGILLPVLYTKITYIHGSYPHQRNYGNDTLIKNIGGTRALFCFYEFIRLSCHIPSPSRLRCYEDSYLGFYETGIVDSCTFEKTGTFTGELEGENEVVRIYPNPAGNTLNISLDNAILRSVVIYDLSGREVFTQTVSDATSREHQLNLSQLPPGAYVMKVETGNGNVIKKLIKQ